MPHSCHAAKEHSGAGRDAGLVHAERAGGRRRSNETILQTADRLGVEIPRLCYMEGMRADGNCRTCMVEIKGERVLAPSCCRYPKEGMDVTTNNAR